MTDNQKKAVNNDYSRDFTIAPPETALGELAWRISNRLTHLLAISKCHSFPLLVIAEHPRSGGTWVSEMLSDYFQIPFPKYSRLPLAFAAVVHTHLWHSPRISKAIFVARDGRDLVVSSYFSTLAQLERLSSIGQQNHRHFRRYPSLRGATTDLADCRKRLPQFIQEWWANPIGCQYNWDDYTTSWTTEAPNVIVTTYESLRANCVSEMARIIGLLTNKPADDYRLAATVQKCSFESQTGRIPGEQDHCSNKRIGQVGNWPNYFTEEAAIVFQRLAGRALVSLKYTSNDLWVERCRAVAERP